MTDIMKRLEKLEQKKSVLPMAYVFFEDGHRERWDFGQISRAFLGDGCGIVRVEWLQKERGIIHELFSDEEYWAELRRIKHDQN